MSSPKISSVWMGATSKTWLPDLWVLGGEGLTHLYPFQTYLMIRLEVKADWVSQRGILISRLTERAFPNTENLIGTPDLLRVNEVKNVEPIA